MMDLPPLFTAASVSPIAARSSPNAPRRTGNEAGGFALALAQSTEETDDPAAPDAPIVQSNPVELTSDDEDNAAHMLGPDISVDIAAMISLKVAESPAALPPVEVATAVDTGETSPQLIANTGALVSPPAAGVAKNAAPKTAAASTDATPKAAILSGSGESDGQTLSVPTSASTAPCSENHRAPIASIEIPVDFPTGIPQRDRSDTSNKAANSSRLADASAAQQIDKFPELATQATETLAPGNAAMGSATLAGGMHGAANVPATISLVPTHTESPAWSKDFGQHLIRLAIEGQPAAEIHLNPPEWGPIHVSIEMNGQDASLQFAAEHMQTREALEYALPRLRELFAVNNLAIVSADINTDPQSPSTPQQFTDSRGQRFQASQHAQGDGRAAQSFAVDDDAPAAPARIRPTTILSRVDLFA